MSNREGLVEGEQAQPGGNTNFQQGQGTKPPVTHMCRSDLRPLSLKTPLPLSALSLRDCVPPQPQISEVSAAFPRRKRTTHMASPDSPPLSRRRPLVLELLATGRAPEQNLVFLALSSVRQAGLVLATDPRTVFSVGAAATNFDDDAYGGKGPTSAFPTMEVAHHCAPPCCSCLVSCAHRRVWFRVSKMTAPAAHKGASAAPRTYRLPAIHAC